MITIKNKLELLENCLESMEKILEGKLRRRSFVYVTELGKTTSKHGFHQYDQEFSETRAKIDFVRDIHQLFPVEAEKYESIVNRYNQMREKIKVPEEVEV